MEILLKIIEYIKSKVKKFFGLWETQKSERRLDLCTIKGSKYYLKMFSEKNCHILKTIWKQTADIDNKEIFSWKIGNIMSTLFKVHGPNQILKWSSKILFYE